jgi:protein transport protein SEC61 subunit gamma-like protein
MEENTQEESREEQPAQLFVKQKSEEFKTQKKNWKEKVKRFAVECKRVLKVTKKPSKEEFRNIVKVTGIGILIIGLLGFVIHVIKELIL